MYKRQVQLSAGRVQTPTLAILTEREKEIQKFIPEPYWLIKAKLQKSIVADHKKGKIFDKKEVDAILKNCKGKDATVEKITNRKTKKDLPDVYKRQEFSSFKYFCNIFWCHTI